MFDMVCLRVLMLIEMFYINIVQLIKKQGFLLPYKES